MQCERAASASGACGAGRARAPRARPQQQQRIMAAGPRAVYASTPRTPRGLHISRQRLHACRHHIRVAVVYGWRRAFPSAGRAVVRAAVCAEQAVSLLSTQQSLTLCGSPDILVGHNGHVPLTSLPSHPLARVGRRPRRRISRIIPGRTLGRADDLVLRLHARPPLHQLPRAAPAVEQSAVGPVGPVEHVHPTPEHGGDATIARARSRDTFPRARLGGSGRVWWRDRVKGGGKGNRDPTNPQGKGVWAGIGTVQDPAGRDGALGNGLSGVTPQPRPGAPWGKKRLDCSLAGGIAFGTKRLPSSHGVTALGRNGSAARKCSARAEGGRLFARPG
eukprot:scaffold10651_cov112-Isochrysis_galbana.AAC.7